MRCSILALVVVAALFASSVSALSDQDVAVSQSMVDFINSQPNVAWTAGHSKRFEGMTIAHARGLCGAKDELVKLPKGPSHDHIKVEDIPASFDSRDQWGSICPSTSHVRDQGSCGSCWAFGAAAAMTDRVCIASKGANAPYLAAEDILSCCGFWCGDGCDGGYPSSAWDYFSSTGVVTGGDYNSGQGCLPYEVPSCDHHVNGTLPPCGDIVPTPACTSQCIAGYPKDFTADKTFGATSYSVDSKVSSIQKEIMTNGPVEVAYTVYADFLAYKSGVYHHVSGAALGGHAVKMLGWGTLNGTDYWTVANSWNTEWGNGGFFLIRRGHDECGIEDGVVAGLPRVTLAEL